MFIDYLTLLLTNLSAGMFILAAYVYKGLDDPDQKRWVPAFSVVGFIALLGGLNLVLNWPLPGIYNIAFGETSVLFGTLMLAASFALAFSWDLSILALYAIFAGVFALEVGWRIIDLGLTQQPLLSGAAFALTGASGIFSWVVLRFKKNKIYRLIAALVLAAAAVLWAATAYPALWSHFETFSKWVPYSMR